MEIPDYFLEAGKLPDFSDFSRKIQANIDIFW